MSTNVRTDGRDFVTQYAMGTVLQPADPVLLKTNSTPGIAPHFNTSARINNAAGTVYDHGTQVAHRQSYLGTGQHAPVVIVGRNVAVKDGDNGFLSWAKDVFVEGRNAVMHAVETGVNSLWNLLPPEARAMIQNGEAIVSGMKPEHFVDAAKEDAQAMMDALMSTDTLIALGQTAALMGLSAIPVVGQLAGGAATAMRIKSAVEAVGGAADELKAIVDQWSQPMTPAQLEAARKRLASWLLRVGIAAILAALGKALPKLSKGAAGRENSEKTVKVGTGPQAQPTSCVCALGNPVIIATGEKTLIQTDFELPGPIPVAWRREYRSGDTRTGWFGTGWSHPLGVELRLGATELHYHDARGRGVSLPALEVGHEHFDAYEEFTLSRPTSHRWELTAKDGRIQVFERAREDLFCLPLATLADRNGNRLSLHYAEPPDDPFDAWRPQGMTDSAGRSLQLEWNAQGLLCAVTLFPNRETSTDPFAQPQALATYAFDASGCLTTVTDAAGAQRQYRWGHGVLVGYTLADGARFAAEYDIEAPTGRVIHSYNEDTGEGLRFTYDPRRRTTRVTDAMGRSTLYEHDEREDIVATTGADGVRVATPFDANGHPRASLDALGRATRYQFDARGNLVTVVDPAGNTTRLAYNALDLPIRLTDALGHSWQREFDERGNLTAVTDPLGHVTRYAHDARGQPVTITDAHGGVKRLDWTPAGDLLRYTDCSGHPTSFRYDDRGRLIARTDALSQTTTYQWDGADRLRQADEPSGAVHRYQWDGEGRLLSYTDPLGAVTRYRYDALGRPVQRIDGAGRSLGYDYEAAGRLATLTNENGAKTRFHYDVADNLVDEIGFDGRHQRYVYNAAGELTHLIEAGGSDLGPGKLTHFERDLLGRLVRKAAEGDASCEARFRYDAAGRLLGADNAAAQLQFAYDPLGQLLSETQTLGGGEARRLAHGYDALGNRTRSELPDGRVLNWLFYGSGHLHQINLEAGGAVQTLTDIERDALHRETERSQGRLTSQYQYDPMGRLARHRASAQGAREAQIERGYAYDAAGNLSERVDALRGTTRYGYDPTGRILAALGPRPEVAERFAFDPAGNMLPSATSQQVIHDNRVRVHEDLRYDYDVHGNVTRRRKGAHIEALLTWNADHQLEQAEVTRHGVTQTTRYEYDPLGRRTRKADAFGATEYLWDGDLMVHSQRGGKEALYVFEPNSFVPLATVQHGHTYWYQCDQIGVPQELTDQEGEVAWAADYRAWGEATLRKTGTDGLPRWTPPHLFQPQTAPRPPVEQPFRLQGQQFDEETGLHYNRFRYYDSAIGRFMGQDPIGINGGFNLFVYGQNPMVWLDPYGLASAGQLGTYGSLNGGTNVGDKLGAHELIRHEALVQMGCTPKRARMVDNPSIALDSKMHGIAHANENALANAHLGNGVHQFQFGADGKPTKQQMDVWQGALRKSGVGPAQARRLRKRSNQFLKSLCCCP